MVFRSLNSGRVWETTAIVPKNNFIPDCGRMESKEKLVDCSHFSFIIRFLMLKIIFKRKRRAFCTTSSSLWGGRPSACGLGFLACAPGWLPHHIISWEGILGRPFLYSWGPRNLHSPLAAREAGKAGHLKWVSFCSEAQKPQDGKGRERGPFCVHQACPSRQGEAEGILWSGVFSPGHLLELTCFLTSGCRAPPSGNTAIESVT